MHINFSFSLKVFAVGLSALVLFFTAFSVSHAQTVQFTTNLYWNIQPVPHPEVKLLQQFLKDQGLYTGDITGGYLTQTYNAVIAFQKKHTITPVSGYFGPDSRIVANKILSGTTVNPVSNTTTQTTTTVTPTTTTVAPVPTTQTTTATNSNMILNPSMETANGSVPLNWAMGKWGTLTTSFAYPVTGQDGSKGAKINVTSYTSGDAKWYFNDVAVTPGKNYTFSEYYKSNVVTNITIRWKKTDGTYTYQSLSNPPIATNWTLRSNTFTVPTNTISMTIFHLIKSVGYLDIDNYKLVQTTTTTPTPTSSTDTSNPTVSITSPISNETVSGTAVVVTATASDNVGVAGVQFKIDGINLGLEDTSSPYSAVWNTKNNTNGIHTVTAVARDVRGNTSNVIRSVTVSNTAVTTIPTPTPATTTTSTTTPQRKLVWGAYAGNRADDLNTFENLVGKDVNIRSVFYKFGDNFPVYYASTLGAEGKTLLLFWESSFGYDTINNGSQDFAIRKFATEAKTYGYPVILSPFHEMNGNWSPWSGTLNNNTPAKFIAAWIRIHGLFKEVGATNVKFALVYNRMPVPDIVGNQFNDYYPGTNYVDYVGLDGFNFGTPWNSFKTIFDAPLKQIAVYNKPIYIFSMASIAGAQKAEWIRDGLGVQIHNYPIEGWVWFHQDGYDGNWLVNSDQLALDAFKKVIPN